MPKVFEQPRHIFPALQVQLSAMQKEDAMPFTPDKTETKILEALFTLYLSTNKQLTRHLYSQGTFSTVKRALAELVREEYLVILNAEERQKHKTKQAVYGIGRKGRIYLKGKDHPVDWRYRGIKERISKNAPIEHTLLVNDLLILAMQLGHEVPHIRLEHNIHEFEFKREPIPVKLEHGTYQLKPDLLLEFLVGQEYFTFLCEVNKSRVTQKVWRNKIRMYLKGFSVIQERVGADLHGNEKIISFPIIVSGENKEKRAREMLSWTRAEMEAQRAADHDDLFPFTISSLDRTPVGFFLKKHWYTPFSQTPEPLLFLPKGGEVD